MSTRPAFLFDLDGTLVDSLYQHVLAWREALEAVSLEISDWRIHRRIGMGAGLLANALLRETGHQVTAEDAARLRDVHAQVYSRLASQVRPLPGARELHARLSRLGAPWAIATGMRQSELLGLTWRDVNEADAVVHVRQQLVYTPGEGFSFSEPKTAKGRRAIALPGMVVEALRAHRTNQARERLLAAEAWEENGLVFPNEIGRPMERGNLVRRSFLPLLDRAGLPQIRFHDLRHTAATLLLSEGAHPKVVQERLGHSTIGVTLDVYSHVLPHMQREAAAKLDRLLGPGSGLL